MILRDFTGFRRQTHQLRSNLTVVSLTEYKQILVNANRNVPCSDISWWRVQGSVVWVLNSVTYIVQDNDDVAINTRRSEMSKWTNQ